MTAIRLEGLTTHEELTAAGRSAIYRFLAEAFAFPTPELGDAVASGRFRDELLAAAAEDEGCAGCAAPSAAPTIGPRAPRPPLRLRRRR